MVYTENSRKLVSIKLFDKISDFNVSYYDYENEKLEQVQYEFDFFLLLCSR